MLRVLRIVRGTRRDGSVDMPLVIAVGTTEVVPLTGTVAVPLGRAGAIPLAIPLAVPLPCVRHLAGVRPVAVVVALAGALIGRSPVPGR
ncbi:hypothetical protein [Streptomyces sp. GbtcB6]|uniref:hypothetical protein n=1 Tax=Streptomyces sp. GbtcB6 TaxID=2824751 RepID=UPI001C30BEB8|nr:hypothetical protein [Streptomyces sp. GbtcB6]